MPHRTLLIKRPLSSFSQEEREALVRALNRVDALGNLWARGFEVYPPDLSPKFAHNFRYFRSEISFDNGVAKPRRWLARVHAIFDVGVGSGKRPEALVIDLVKGVLRLRGIIKGRAIVISLTDGEVKYIRSRLSENAKPKLANAWTDGEYLYIAIVFEREVEPIQPSGYTLVIDVNSWRHGIAYAIINKNGRIAEFSS
ncbi:hypothetical protein [Vulcanisaeta sp. JCM 16159]|uniref:hypothetical protein n=1 Tax=Vulcanisaeta sp. JCM 16159 TaxID=1295371 RepID=UPI001FB4EF9B|nr:hypothetical protein [Vulcanisaeta sp. JCM 16159]